MADMVNPHTWVALEVPTAANFNAINTEIITKYNANAVRIDKSTAGDLLAVDGLYDIGKSGATRFRDIFPSRDIGLLFGGKLKWGAAFNAFITTAQIIASSAADVDLILGKSIFAWVVDEVTGAGIAVPYQDATAPNLLGATAVEWTTGAPGANEMQIKNRTGNGGLAIKASAGRNGNTVTCIALVTKLA